jgi:DNA-binding Xre family transcriptional regulator
MQILYYKLFNELKNRGIMQKTFINDLFISGVTMQHLRHNESVTMETIGKICEYLQCQPSDIVEIVFDDGITDEYKKRQIAELETQINDYKRQIAENETQIAKLKTL